MSSKPSRRQRTKSKPQTTARSHDGGYKAIFSCPEPVRDLIVGFCPDAWLQNLDFSTLEKMPDSYITDSLHARANDVVWRVKVGGQWVYLYLMLEFQSSVDKYMAVRMLVYVGLLYQALIKRGEILENGQLPPILPLVLYNGSPRWTAATNIAELIPAMPGVLQTYRPQMAYLVIDEGSYSEQQLAGLHNIAAALFRVENLCAPEVVQELIEQLDLWTEDNQELKRTIAQWLRTLFMRHSSYNILLPDVQTLKEMKMALAERMTQWAENYKAQGMEKGMEKGLERGREQGRRTEAANLLLTLLSARFGQVPEDVAVRVQDSSADVIEMWFQRAISAPSLALVFGDAHASH